MPSEFVQPYREAIEFAFSHFDKFADICGDAVWNETFGGWPVGEQYYHALMGTAMLIGSIGGIRTDNPLPEAGHLDRRDLPAPDREQTKAFLLRVRESVRKTLDGLSDQDLLKKNDMVSQKFGKPVTNAFVLSLIGEHLQYHLGSCDAALRNTGKEGSW